MTAEKRQTSQGYIIRILQHFATKRRNITNFVMRFPAVVKCLSRLVEWESRVIRPESHGEKSPHDWACGPNEQNFDLDKHRNVY
jgi:hypothetical protein